jgi:segregation and condensation protein B
MSLSGSATAVEAILFASGEPLEVATLCTVIGLPQEAVLEAVEELDAHLRTAGHGLRVQRQDMTLQLVTAPEVGPLVARLQGAPRQTRLSAAALDTLAIIAYRQPITRQGIEAIRGVNSEHVLQVLINLGLVEETGRAASIGRPVLYGTTRVFLHTSGLTSLDDLPPLPEE